MLQYRNTPNQTTKLSPAMCLFGRPIRYFIPILPGKYFPHPTWQSVMRIQNQTGIYPRRWDRTGSVVEVRQYDQYVIRVDGSGRVTLRNRKFLRKFNPVQPDTPFDRLIQAWQRPAAPDIPLPNESTSNDAPQVNELYPDRPDSGILPIPERRLPDHLAHCITYINYSKWSSYLSRCDESYEADYRLIRFI